MIGDITIYIFIITLIIASLFVDGVFIFNQIYSSKLTVKDCEKGYRCVSDNLISSMSPPEKCSLDCVTKGFYGGYVRGCCVKGTGEQKLEPISIIVIIVGFLIIFIGILFLYIKYSEWKEKRLEYDLIV